MRFSLGHPLGDLICRGGLILEILLSSNTKQVFSMVSASHQFCLGLFVPLPDNPQSIFLEWLVCAGTIFPYYSGIYISGHDVSSGKHQGLTEKMWLWKRQGFWLETSIHLVGPQ